MASMSKSLVYRTEFHAQWSAEKFRSTTSCCVFQRWSKPLTVGKMLVLKFEKPTTVGGPGSVPYDDPDYPGGGVGRFFVFLKQILVTISKSCDKILQIETIFLFVSSCQDVETLFNEF